MIKKTGQDKNSQNTLSLWWFYFISVNLRLAKQQWHLHKSQKEHFEDSYKVFEMLWIELLY